MTCPRRAPQSRDRRDERRRSWCRDRWPGREWVRWIARSPHRSSYRRYGRLFLSTAGSSTVDLCVTGKCSRVPFDAHLSTPHRVALDLAAVRSNPALARQAKTVPRRSRCFSQSVGGDSNSIPRVISTMHSLHLPWVMHDVGTRDAGLFGGRKERDADRNVDSVSVDDQRRGHGLVKTTSRRRVRVRA